MEFDSMHGGCSIWLQAPSQCACTSRKGIGTRRSRSCRGRMRTRCLAVDKTADARQAFAVAYLYVGDELGTCCPCSPIRNPCVSQAMYTHGSHMASRAGLVASTPMSLLSARRTILPSRSREGNAMIKGARGAQETCDGAATKEYMLPPRSTRREVRSRARTPSTMMERRSDTIQ